MAKSYHIQWRPFIARFIIAKFYTSPFRASYGVSFMSTSTKIDRVIKGFYCMKILWYVSFKNVMPVF